MPLSFFKRKPKPSNDQVKPSSARSKPSATQTDFDQAGKTARGVLTKALKAVQLAINALPIPGAQLAISAFLEILERLDSLDENVDDLHELHDLLTRLTDTILSPLSGKNEDAVSPDLRAQIEILTQDLQKIAFEWKETSSHGIGYRFVQANEQKTALATMVQKIKNALDIFNLGALIIQDVGDVRRDGVLANIAEHLNEHHEKADLRVQSQLVDKLPRALQASFDSVRTDSHSTCLLGTRTAILEGVDIWIDDTSPNARRIYWMNGMAGIGKSTIAKTIAARAKQANRLGGSYFFSRNEAMLQNPALVIPTIAYQLAQYDSRIKVSLAEAVDRDSDIGHRSLQLQFEHLIIHPMANSHMSPSEHPFIVVIDALDECEESGTESILRLLLEAMHSLPAPFKVLITSRPEPHISRVLDSDGSHHRVQLHDVEESVVQGDIRLYLDDGIKRIEKDLRWPANKRITEAEMDNLVELSGKLFVYAATALRFIGDTRVRKPRNQLDIILGQRQVAVARPLLFLDTLYLQILNNTVSPLNTGDSLELFQLVVGAVVLIRNPLPMIALDSFLGLDEGDCSNALYYLPSLILVPPTDDQAPRIYHKSLPDFIVDPSRCTDARFLIIKSYHERRIALRCLELINSSLRRDIAGIEDSSLINEEVIDLKDLIAAAIPPEVEYACRFWSSHLVTALPSDKAEYDVSDKGLSKRIEELDRDLNTHLEDFTNGCILYWIEAMSLLGSVSEAISCVREAKQWAISNGHPSSVIALLDDAHRFTLAHREVISIATLHIYHSALPFTPRGTLLYKQYKHELNESLVVIGGIDPSWSPCISTLEPETGKVNSVTFSPDGLMIASATDDRNVLIWDSTSFAHLVTLEHPLAVNCATFSPSGKQIASASDDGNIRIWDTTTGALLRTLTGHDDAVTSVAYTSISATIGISKDRPERMLLASCSKDTTVRLWDTDTGKEIFSLKGHTNWIWSVAFSNDGNRLASGGDCSIRIWDVASGARLLVIKAHTESAVVSIAWSPDGARIVSAGCEEKVACIWDTVSGELLSTLKGHWGTVWDVVWSGDGQYIGTASFDTTFRIWDVESGISLVALKAHSSWVCTVAFSPKLTTLASGGNANGVRIWDITDLSSIISIKSFINSVYASTISADGRFFATACDGGVTSIWNAETGERLAQLDASLKIWVRSVAFTKDAKQVAIAGTNGAVYIWDIPSRTLTVTLRVHRTPPCEDETTVYSLVFSPDGSRIAVGCENSNLTVFKSSPNSTRPLPLIGHSDAIRCLLWSENGDRLVSGSLDQSIIVWDISSGSSVMRLRKLPGPVISLALAPNKIYLTAVTVSEAGVRERLAWDFSSLRRGSKSLSKVALPFCDDPQSRWVIQVENRKHWLWIQVSDEEWMRVCYIPGGHSVTSHTTAGNRLLLGCLGGQVLILDISHCNAFNFE